MTLLANRWLLLGVLSAVLNVFLVGFLAGRHAFGPGGCSSRGFMRHDRESLHPDVLPKAERARLRAHLGEVGQAREQVRAALKAEPFDPARLEAALKSLRDHSAALQLDMHQRLNATAGSLTAEQRQRMADSRFFNRPHGR